MEFLSYELSDLKSPTVRRKGNSENQSQPHVSLASTNLQRTESQTNSIGVKSCEDLRIVRGSRPIRPYRAARWFIQHIMGRAHARHKSLHIRTSEEIGAERQPPPESILSLTSEDIKRYRSRSRRVTLNVGGKRHEVLWETLARIPNSRLGRLSQSTDPTEIYNLCDEYVPETNEFYFDRPTRSFSAVLGLYRTGHLHIVDDVCMIALKDDLNYWGISEHLMDPCCLHRYYQRKEQMEEEIKKTNEICMQQEQEERFGQGKLAKCRRKIWDLVEKPQTSMAARVFAVISITFILLSIIGLNLSTMPELRVNVTHVNDTPPTLIHEDTHLVINPKLEVLELVCTIWFTFELVVRFTVAPDKCAFVKSPMNLIDVIAILPFYFSKIFEFWLNSTVESLVSVRKVVQMFRILRILRVFKLARHSQGLQALGYTLTQSYKELGLLMMFVILVVLLFSSLAYFAEKDDNAEMFTSIPATFWWAIITMTTVGYGDITPKTVLGKLIGSVCCICGVLVVGLPIPIIVNNFAAFYQDQMRRDKVFKQQKATEAIHMSGNATGRYSLNSPPTRVDQTGSTQTNRLLTSNETSNMYVPVQAADEEQSAESPFVFDQPVADPHTSTQLVNEVQRTAPLNEDVPLKQTPRTIDPSDINLLITNPETNSPNKSSSPFSTDFI